DLADLVGPPRVIEDALGRRRLARVDVGHDPDVPGLLECVLARHGSAQRWGEMGKKNGPLGPARTIGLMPGGRAMCSRSPFGRREPFDGANRTGARQTNDERL